MEDSVADANEDKVPKETDIKMPSLAEEIKAVGSPDSLACPVVLIAPPVAVGKSQIPKVLVSANYFQFSICHMKYGFTTVSVHGLAHGLLGLEQTFGVPTLVN